MTRITFPAWRCVPPGRTCSFFPTLSLKFKAIHPYLCARGRVCACECFRPFHLCYSMVSSLSCVCVCICLHYQLGDQIGKGEECIKLSLHEQITMIRKKFIRSPHSARSACQSKERAFPMSGKKTKDLCHSKGGEGQEEAGKYNPASRYLSACSFLDFFCITHKDFPSRHVHPYNHGREGGKERRQVYKTYRKRG